MDRLSPLSLKYHGNVRLGADATAEASVLQKLVQDGLKADQDRAGWLENQIGLTKLRFGIRKPKVFPWRGASNLGVPFIDQIIRKFKPMLMRLIVEPDPIVEFVGEDAAAAEKERLAETLYTWLFKTEMNAVEPMAYVIDQLCHRGFSFVQVGWDYRTEYETRIVSPLSLFPGGLPQDPQEILTVLLQQYDLDPNDKKVVAATTTAANGLLAGAPYVKLVFKRVIADRPILWDRDPIQVITPPRTPDVGNAEWIIIQHLMSFRQIQQKEADGFFATGTAATIRSTRKTDTRTLNELSSSFTQSLSEQDSAESARERIWGREDEDNVLVWEIFHWHDYDGDGLLERCHTFVHPKSHTKLRCTAFFYPFHQWPLVKFDFEKVNRRWHSPRGVSAMLKDLQREVNAQHNARIDGMTLRNAPCYQIPLVAGFKARNFRVRPGEVLHVPYGTRLEPLIQDRGSYPEMVNEENLLRSLGENYVGVFDAAITSPQSQTQARTATEIQAVMQYTAATSTLDAILFQLSMREVHTLIWELWLDLGPPEVSIKVLGASEDTNDPIPTLVTKADINRKFKLIPTGTIANTNRALEMGNARDALSVFLNDQTGLIDKYELFRWYLNLLTYRWARRILLPKDQANNQQIMAMAAQALQQNAELSSTIGLGVPPSNYGPPQGSNVPEMGDSGVT